MRALRSAAARLACIALMMLALPATATATAPPARAQAALRLGPGIERIARLHAQAGQGVLAQRSRRALAESMREFDATLRAALAAAPDPETRESYVLLAMLWHDYRDWAQRPATRETARKLRERTEEVAWVAAKGLRLMTEHARGGVSASAVRAGQVALAAQRVPKVYLWRRWDLRDEALDRELREARDNVPRALDALAASPAVPAEAIETARTQWRFLADAGTQLDAAPGNARALEFACKAADHILEAMQALMVPPARASGAELLDPGGIRDVERDAPGVRLAVPHAQVPARGP